MDFQPQARREARIRLFKSDFVESLTRVHPALVVAVWLPAIVWFSWHGCTERPAGMTPGNVATAHVVGLLVWTLVEYSLHRFVFHFSPPNPPAWLHRLLFLFHGVHHVQPWDKQRLVMPPAVSVPLAVGFYALFAWLLGDLLAAPGWQAPMFAGFLAGYLAYDLLHYATHHLPMTGPVGRWLKRHHLLHHHLTPGERFGVSSPLWDLAFRTLPRDQADRGEEVRAG